MTRRSASSGRKRGRTRARHATSSSRASSPGESLIEKTVERIGKGLRDVLGPRAYVGAAVAGGVAFAAANAVGVGELAFGLAGAYVAFRVLRDRVSIRDAVKEGVKAKEGRGPMVRENGEK